MSITKAAKQPMRRKEVLRRATPLKVRRAGLCLACGDPYGFFGSLLENPQVMGWAGKFIASASAFRPCQMNCRILEVAE